jgi:hypothetical protein
MNIIKIINKIEKKCTRKNSRKDYIELWSKFINNEIGRIELIGLFNKLENNEKNSI